MQQLLLQDHIRHFGGMYLPMLTNISDEIAHNLQDLPEKMTVPFCILFGAEDPLCNIAGAWEMYFSCSRVKKGDKRMIEFQHAVHQLYLEIPAVREKAMRETLDFLSLRALWKKSLFSFFIE